MKVLAALCLGGLISMLVALTNNGSLDSTPAAAATFNPSPAPGAGGDPKACAPSCLPDKCVSMGEGAGLTNCPLQDRCEGALECVLTTRYRIDGSTYQTCRTEGECNTRLGGNAVIW